MILRNSASGWLLLEEYVTMHGPLNAKVFLIIIRINSDHTEQHTMHGPLNAKVFLIIIRINSDHTEQHSPFAVCNGGTVCFL